MARIITNGDHSEIYVVVRNNTGKNLFEVPIAYSDNILQSGILNLDGQQPFRIIGKAWYERRHGERITIRKLRELFP